jgi:hypothetical protein
VFFYNPHNSLHFGQLLIEYFSNMAPFIEEQKSPGSSSVSDGISDTENPELDGNGTEPIAIIGFSFKFPDDADTPEGFWKMLMEQTNTARDFPADRINVNGHYRKENRHNSVSVWFQLFFDEVHCALSSKSLRKSSR